MEQTPFLDAARGTREFEEILGLAKAKHERFRRKYFPDRD
jgi:hypothetical protein